MYKHRDMLVRFWSKVKIGQASECWGWTASKNRAGYGRIGCRKGVAGEYAHRFSWALANGADPHGMEVMHSCDNPPCVNPRHLSLGTRRDNVNDCWSKGRGTSGFSRWDQPSGEAAHKSKLRQCEVDEIRRLRRLGVTGMLLAKMFPVVHHQQIYRICGKESWRG
jgi:hypothetical protein